MSKYKVTISRTVVQNATVEVDSDDSVEDDIDETELTLDEKLEWLAGDKASETSAWWDKDEQYYLLTKEEVK